MHDNINMGKHMYSVLLNYYQIDISVYRSCAVCVQDYKSIHSGLPVVSPAYLACLCCKAEDNSSGTLTFVHVLTCQGCLAVSVL